MFSLLDYVQWASVFILEAAGAILFFRRNKYLSAVLAFRAAADLLGFFLGPEAFRWEDYLQRMIQMPLLAVLAVDCAGRAAGAHHREIRLYAAPVATLSAIALAAMHGAFPWDLPAVLWIEEKTVYFLAAVVVLGWLVRKAERVRGNIDSCSAGLLMLLISYGVGAMAKEHSWLTWAHANRGVQYGSILALLVWVAGPILPHKLKDCRLSLGKQYLDVQKVTVI